MFQVQFCVYVCLLYMCLTVWASIGDRRLFETRRLLELGHQNPQRLFETWHLLEVLRYCPYGIPI